LFHVPADSDVARGERDENGANAGDHQVHDCEGWTEAKEVAEVRLVLHILLSCCLIVGSIYGSVHSLIVGISWCSRV